jgi:hypothetical protein
MEIKIKNIVSFAVASRTGRNCQTPRTTEAKRWTRTAAVCSLFVTKVASETASISSKNVHLSRFFYVEHS